jgi:hypothetical protein
MVAALRTCTEPKRRNELAEVGIVLTQRLLEVGPGRPGTDAQGLALPGHGLQLAHAAHMNERGDVAMQLGDPQSHVGGAGQDGRLRVLLAETGQLRERSGRKETPAPVLQADRLGVAHGLELLALYSQRLLLRGRSRHIVHRLCGAHDRPVAGATAEVASENVVDAAGIGLRFAEVGRIERHDEPGRAEAALRAMAVGKRPLHWMRGAIFALQVLHRHDAAPLQHWQQQDAGIDGAVMHGAVAQLSDHDGAGAAIAFRAAFLGAGQPLGLTQIVEEGRGGRNIPQRLKPSIEEERNAVAHHRESTSVASPRQHKPVGSSQDVAASTIRRFAQRILAHVRRRTEPIFSASSRCTR